MKYATICLLVEGNPAQKILLGLKKKGFGKGKIVGFGGKIEPTETVEQAVVRELREETSITVSPEQLKKAGTLTFLFPAKPAWDHYVHVYILNSWKGAPLESSEIEPFWFNVHEIPYERMWADGYHWIPRALSGEMLDYTYTYHDENQSLKKIKGNKR
ncbi:MAG: NUDIX domain-containing protein [Anaerolineales bacterium]|nr:NUDIX domain-containing protein [Anaerolineales bacterium]